jgi:hypothetical protein
MSFSSVGYYRDILAVKKKFIKSLEVCCPKKIDIYKIWAHWLIGLLSKREQNYQLLMPESVLFDEEHIVKHMVEKGVDALDADKIYRTLMHDYHNLFQIYATGHYEMLKSYKALCTYSRIVTDITSFDQSLHTVSLNDLDVSLKITTNKYQKLKSQYIGPKELFPFYLFEYLFNYYFLDGKSLQWSLPTDVFQYLNENGLSGELFASPSNSYHSNFFSLFYVDCFFGAKGNFFSTTCSDQLMLGGFYEINPPFVEKIFESSCAAICNFMEKCPTALGFLYIMPLWKDHPSYDYLISSAFFIDKMLLEKFHHYYQAGVKYILASFDTVLIIVGNVAFRELNPTSTILANIQRRFSSRPVGSQMEDGRDRGLMLI